jgi:hypothetical protein
MSLFRLLSVRRSLLRLALLWVGSEAGLAMAGEIHFGEHDVKTVFAIGKSDDGNQVQYALRLNKECQPVGNDPVFGYWREYDRHERLLPMSFLDGFGYGISKQKVRGSHVTITIKPAAKREIELVASQGPEGSCHAEAFTDVNGHRVRLTLIFLTLSGPFSVSKVELRGTDAESGAEVSELLKL